MSIPALTLAHIRQQIMEEQLMEDLETKRKLQEEEESRKMVSTEQRGKPLQKGGANSISFVLSICWSLIGHLWVQCPLYFRCEVCSWYM